MKALVYTAVQTTDYRDAPEPECGPDDALVKVEAVGICGSDMHAWHGHDPLATPTASAQYDLVLDAVGSVATRASAIAAASPGGVISHVGLQAWAGEFDTRTLTLQEVTLVGVYTYNDADLRASLAALHDGRIGNLDWIEQRPLSLGGEAIKDLDANRTRAAKVILRP